MVSRSLPTRTKGSWAGWPSWWPRSWPAPDWLQVAAGFGEGHCCGLLLGKAQGIEQMFYRRWLACIPREEFGLWGRFWQKMKTWRIYLVSSLTLCLWSRCARHWMASRWREPWSIEYLILSSSYHHHIIIISWSYHHQIMMISLSYSHHICAPCWRASPTLLVWRPLLCKLVARSELLILIWIGIKIFITVWIRIRIWIEFSQ